MTFVPKTAARYAGVLGFLALTSTVAFGLPWDIDMADAQFVRAYEWEIAPIPEGSVPQDNKLTPARFAENHELGTDATQALVNPVPNSPAHLELGEEMYGIYCTPCHANGQELGKVSEAGYPGIAILAGSAGRLKQITDGHLYVTIRNGKGLMPAYGWSMNETEMWSLVHYLRTMPDSAAYVPPPPAPEEEPTP
jgi:mono/diheme cytochrome c family protein